MTEEQLSALLRLKRFEQPPPGYFDDLLRNIHQRQRAELLKRPLWKIAAERIQTFFGEHSMSPASYAGAMATLLILGVTVIGVMGPGNVPGPTTGGGIASKVPPGSTLASSGPILQLQTAMPSQRPLLGWDKGGVVPAKSQPARNPRYVIDARPVSYEASFRF